MTRRTFVSPDGHAVLVCDAGMFGDRWTLSVGQQVVASQRVGLVAQLATGLAKGVGGWGGFQLDGGGYSARVYFHPRTRVAHVFFLPSGMSWTEFEATLASQLQA